MAYDQALADAEAAIARVRELHKPETRYTTDGTWSEDNPDEARIAAGLDDVSALKRFEICTHCGDIEMRQAEFGDYLDALWPCATIRALDGEN